jgi:hypothetical protein
VYVVLRAGYAIFSCHIVNLLGTTSPVSIPKYGRQRLYVRIRQYHG